MAYQPVHTFSIGSCDYTVMVDFELQEVTCIGVPDPPDSGDNCTPPATVTEEELAFQVDEAYAATCIGDTYVKAFAQLTFPFVYLEVTENSLDCTYVPPPCNFTFETESTNSTNGNNNGSLTVINISETGMFSYSLDNSIWQDSPVFNFLFSGTYNIYVRRKPDGCVKTALIVISNITVADELPPGTIPYQYSNRLCFFFRLIINGITTYIREPIKWSDVNIIGERDDEFHGYQFKYSDGNFSLGFDCKSGREQIEAVYNQFGQDGEVSFQFGYDYLNVQYLLFDGKLMLNTYKWFVDHVECTVESKELDTVFTSRLETKVSMKQAESFDGDAVPVPSEYNIELHAKEILTTIYEDTLSKSFSSFSSTGGPIVYIKPDNTNVTFSETEDNYQYPLGSQPSNPVDVDEYILQPQQDGTATIHIILNHAIQLIRTANTDATFYEAKVYLVRKKFNIVSGIYETLNTDITTTPVSGFTSFDGILNSAQFAIAADYTFTDDFLADDAIYCFVQIDITGFGFISTRTNILQNRFLFDCEYLEQSEATNANGWFLQDVIRHCINCITNNGYALRSSFFQIANAVYPFTDGCGSKYLLTNGFQIRQFDVDNRPLKIDLRTALRSLNAQFCIGYNYLNDDSGSYIRIERRDYFYQEREILSIEELEEYREEVANDIIYNEIDIGYNKYKNSGFNSLDEFNTKAQWLTPIKKNKKKLPQLSDLIASGYSIESIRREQFAEKPSSSVENDDDPFIIAIARENATDWVTEKNENFETVTGLISPSTVYNLRLSPTRMLYNWFIWLKGIFAYKTADDNIKNTERIQNNDLITRFNSSETCRVGDENRSVIDETEAIRMAELNSTRDIYRPERVFIKCRLNPVQVQTLNLAMTGRYGDQKDYGYIMVYNPQGYWQAIWLQKFSYNFYTEKAEIVGLKKFDSPAAPETEECCLWLAVNNCYLLVNGIKIVA